MGFLTAIPYLQGDHHGQVECTRDLADHGERVADGDVCARGLVDYFDFTRDLNGGIPILTGLGLDFIASDAENHPPTVTSVSLSTVDDVLCYVGQHRQPTVAAVL